jgi:hypothetical protein
MTSNKGRKGLRRRVLQSIPAQAACDAGTVAETTTHAQTIHLSHRKGKLVFSGEGEAERNIDGEGDEPPPRPSSTCPEARPAERSAALQQDLLTTANDLYRAIDAQSGISGDDEEYWQSFPPHIRNFVRLPYCSFMLCNE